MAEYGLVPTGGSFKEHVVELSSVEGHLSNLTVTGSKVGQLLCEVQI